jgi:hypothetical protein
VAVIVGRIQVDSESDLPAVHTLQDRFTLAPLDPGQPAPNGLPAIDPAVGEDLAFWARLRAYMAAYPPPAGDAEFVAALDRLGVTADTWPSADELAEGARAGAGRIEHLATAGSAGRKGWTSALHSFDYNIDRLGLGTIDAPEWKFVDRKRAYLNRAVVARAGLWGVHGYEANYYSTWVDADGEALDGAHTYELTLSPPPPVGAFWSLTMYDVPDFYLVENPIDRYSVGDRTPGVQYAPDGSVTIYMQTESPGPDRESNWLPTPAGAFRPVLRTYEPGEAIFDGSYRVPDIRRTG